METRILYLLLWPLLGGALLGAAAFLGSRRLEKWAGWVASGAILLSLIEAVRLFAHLLAEPEGAVVLALGQWMHAGPLRVDAVLRVDALSAPLLLIVTGVGLLVHLYSTSYMSHDRAQTKYFAYLNLFCAFMLLLLTGGTLPLVFVGWEGVGLMSFLLIGFWAEERKNSFAGRKAFIVNRIGDAGFLLGMFLVFKTFGTLDLAALAAHPALASLGGSLTVELCVLLLFVGAVGKSAQFPLYLWLPDAMAGPTPVSALMHAATMVTAGVYLLARTYFLVELAPSAMEAIAFTGALTALFAATVALFQTDIKKILAFSTVSQLGFMILAVGSGNPDAAVYHLVTHAYFKALLFLAAGSVIHALHGEQDIRNMGGLRTYLMPTTITFIFGYCAIIGMPPFSGWFTKDAILHGVLAHGHGALFGMGLAAAMLTATYMTKLYYSVFLGNARSTVRELRDIHDSPMAMIAPMGALALLSFIGGVGWFRFEPLLSHHFHVAHAAEEGGVSEVQLALIVTGLSLGCVAATYLWMKASKRGGASAFAPVSAWIGREYGIHAFLVRAATFLSLGAARLLDAFDRRVVDRVVNLVGSAAVWGGTGLSRLQTGRTQTYSYAFVVGSIALAIYLLKAGR